MADMTLSTKLVTGEKGDDVSLHSEEKSYGKGRCQLPPSPYPIYIANLLYAIPHSINKVAFEDMLYNKICHQHYQDSALCANSTFSTSHPQLQEKVTAWSNYNSLAIIPLSILTNLMMSFYCDKAGHRLPYVLACIGVTLCTSYLALLSSPQYIDWPLPCIFGYSILYSILGSVRVISTASFSYIGLIATKMKSATALAASEGALLLGLLVGSLITGPIIDSIGLPALMYISAGLSLLPIIIIMAFLTDVTVGNESVFTWRDLVDLSNIVGALKCAFRKREGNKRLLLSLSFAVYTCIYSGAGGFSAASFLYFVKEKGLSITQYSIYNGYFYAIRGFVGPAFIFLLKKYLKLQWPTLGLISLSCTVVGYAVIPIDSIPYAIWIGATLLGPQIAAFAIVSSLQISLCEKEELGRVLAFNGIIHSTVCEGVDIAIRALYSLTLTVWSGVFLAVLAFINLIGLIIFICFSFLKTSNDHNNEAVN